MCLLYIDPPPFKGTLSPAEEKAGWKTHSHVPSHKHTPWCNADLTWLQPCLRDHDRVGSSAVAHETQTHNLFLYASQSDITGVYWNGVYPPALIDRSLKKKSQLYVLVQFIPLWTVRKQKEERKARSGGRVVFSKRWTSGKLQCCRSSFHSWCLLENDKKGRVVMWTGLKTVCPPLIIDRMDFKANANPVFFKQTLE